jgi:hypothetical protein
MPYFPASIIHSLLSPNFPASGFTFTQRRRWSPHTDSCTPLFFADSMACVCSCLQNGV